MGSSEVSLTPAVMRDPVTDEMVLEGALVLADNGICCIDEIGRKYTKLWSKRPHHLESGNHHDTHRTSLTPILTVANPLYGRYNPKVSPLENINLPAALLSRFDLLFLLLDKPSRDDSERLAQHVTHVHLYNGHLDFEYEPLAPALMRAYIALARRCRTVALPDVSSTSSTLTCACASSPKSTYSATTRTHTSALRLMAASKESPHDEDRDDADARDADCSDTSRLYTKDMAQAAVAASTRRAMRERLRRLGQGPDHQRDVQDEEGEGGGPVDVLSMVDIRARMIYRGTVDDNDSRLRGSQHLDARGEQPKAELCMIVAVDMCIFPYLDGPGPAVVLALHSLF